ncbi:MAG: hypothetical protein EHM48_02955, partial [Planctomycetaceae bacterium]
GQTTPSLPLSFNSVVARAASGIILLLYHVILWVYKQIFPETADYAALVLLGKLVGISPTPSVAAVITANVYGTTGESVAVGTAFKSSTNQVYTVTTGGLIAGGLKLCTLTAVSAGDAGNIADGEALSIVTPDPVLTGAAVVVSTTTDGDDEESEASFRARVIARYKRRHTGGSPADYYLWGIEAPHFTWVSPYAGDEPLDVYVYGEVDNQTDGIPTTAQLSTLKEYLTTNPETGLADRKPVCDVVTCFPITRKEFDVIIDIKDGTAQVKADITTAITDYMLDLEPYNEGVSLLRNDTMTDTGISSAAFDVASEGGASILDLVVQEAGYQISSYVLYGGEKAKLGSITFVDRV